MAEEATVDEFMIDNADNKKRKNNNNNNNSEIANPKKKTDIVDSETTSEEVSMLQRRRGPMTLEMIDELRKALEERETRVEILERERNILKQTNAKSEMKVRELERKLLVWEMKETEERSKRVRVEEEMREKIEGLAEALRESEEREKGKEWVVIGLRERLKEADQERVRMGEETAINGGDGEEGDEENKVMMELRWSLGFAGAVTAVVAAVIYLWFGKRKSSYYVNRG